MVAELHSMQGLCSPPEIEPVSLEVGAWRPNHQTTREFSPNVLYWLKS